MTCSNYCLRHIIDTLRTLSTNEHVSYTDEEFVPSEDIIITKYPEYSPFGRGSKVTLLCGKSKVEFAKKKLFTTFTPEDIQALKNRDLCTTSTTPTFSNSSLFFKNIFIILNRSKSRWNRIELNDQIVCASLRWMRTKPLYEQSMF